MAKKNQNKIFGLNRNIFFIMVFALGLFLIIGVSGGGSSDSVRVWEDSATLQDNTEKDEIEQDKVKTDEGTASSDATKKNNQSNDIGNSGDFEASFNDSSNTYDLSNGTDTYVLEESDLLDSIDLSNNEKLVHYSYNDEFNLNGFPFEYEAFLIKNDENNLFYLYWRIGNEVFYIPELYETKREDYDIQARNAFLLQNIGQDDINTTYYSNVKLENNENQINDINNFLYIENNKLNLIKRFKNGCCIGNKNQIRVLNKNTFEERIILGSTNHYDEKLFQFSINEKLALSRDSIALTTTTRTTGFNKVTLTKQEMGDSHNNFQDKYFKIINNQDMENIKEENTNVLSEFMINRFEENIDTQNLNNKLIAGTESYVIGDDVQGILIDNGYVEQNDLSNDAQVTEISQISFSQEGNGNNNYKDEGFQITDLGLSRVKGIDVVNYNFGNIKNMNMTSHGTSYFIGSSVWNDVFGVIKNILTFDFSGIVQFFTDESDDVTFLDDIETGNINGDVFGYTSGYKDAGRQVLTLTQQKPLESLLTFEGENYWLFYTLETDTQGKKGCMVFDVSNTNLDVRIPSSVCSEVVAGTNSLAQFKISSSDAVN